jgi:predicted nucleic acid-binding protein
VRGPITVDASVFLNAANTDETGHDTSRRFLEWLQAERIPVVLPTLVLPEVAAGARRISGSGDIARMVASGVEHLSGAVFVSLDDSLADAAADLAMTGGMKGSDAVYGATAQRFGATLVTLDRQQRTRLPSDVEALSPGEALER